MRRPPFVRPALARRISAVCAVLICVQGTLSADTGKWLYRVQQASDCNDFWQRHYEEIRLEIESERLLDPQAKQAAMVWPSDKTPLDVLIRRTRRRVALQNPLLDFSQLLFGAFDSTGFVGAPRDLLIGAGIVDICCRKRGVSQPF